LLDLSCFTDSLVKKNTRSDVYVKVAIYVESYGNGSCEMGFVSMSLVSSNTFLEVDDETVGYDA
jgi:hypothetical protein